VALLTQAQRPLLLAGGGIIDSEASEEAVALAELLDMAVVPSYGHNDVVPNSHRLYVGPPGGRGAGEALEAMHRADVILALGTRINQGSTGWNYSVINPQTRIVRRISTIEIGRTHPWRWVSSAMPRPWRSNRSGPCAINSRKDDRTPPEEKSRRWPAPSSPSG
jgi:thiamine pyrophosphate-dependent acetolactate synthase large subunit-like protein